MVTITNLAQFKRAMTVGTEWKYYDAPGAEPIVRTCRFSQTKSFALDNHPNRKDKSEASWLDYPAAKEILFIQEGGKSTLVKIYNPVMGNYLYYQPNL